MSPKTRDQSSLDRIAPQNPAKGVWKLPPLILHPFAGEGGAERLLEGSRASLSLKGLLPGAVQDEYELNRLILDGRYHEVRMLYFLGKDLLRWVEQCVDFALRVPELAKLGINEQSFTALLVEGPPDAVSRKLKAWGVGDQRAIFSRAIGLNAVFEQPPTVEQLSPVFLRSYHRFADHLYICYQHMAAFTPIFSSNFLFDLYASEEYARLLANEWEA